MRTFEEFINLRPLTKYLVSGVGVLFYGDDNAGRILVRKFPSAKICKAYVEILYAVKRWIEDRGGIGGAVEILSPFETGSDFIAREHRIFTGTDELMDEECNVDLPSEFFNQRKLIASSLTEANGLPHNVIENVVKNSLLEPAGKTYFDFTLKRFVIVEPKISPADIELWCSQSD
ncbi:hypothetical protein [Pseudoduganella sp. HUAS MS19]